MKPFTKLFSSITSSSIWRQADHVRLVWITMLAACDKDGEVWASVGGLADLARVTRDQCKDALLVLMSPDEDSRTKEHDGRRVEEIDGGWRLLNYRKYRELGRGEDRREYHAEYQRKRRSGCQTLSTMSTIGQPMSPIAEAEAEAEAEANTEGEREPDTTPPPVDSLFSLLSSSGAILCRGTELIHAEWLAAVKGHSVSWVMHLIPRLRPTWPSDLRKALKDRREEESHWKATRKGASGP